MNIKVISLTFLISLPVFLALTGSFFLIDFNFIAIYLLLLLLFTVMLSYKLSYNIYVLSRATSFRTIVKYKVIFYFIFSVYIIYTYPIFSYLNESLYNMTKVRHDLIRDQKIIDIVFFGNVYLRMIFDFIFTPFVLFVLFSHQRWDKFKIILCLFFVISNTLVGGRFGIYKIFIFIAICLLSKNDHVRTKRFIQILILSSVLVIFVQINRAINAYDVSILSTIPSLFKSIYLYHAIQPGVMISNINAPEQFGYITGIITPIYILLGLKTPEGLIADNLFKNYFLYDGGYYNAFGTSAIYFITSYGYIGILLYGISLSILTIYSIAYSKKECSYSFLMFILYSMFFSMFQPYIWSFSWYMTIVFFVFFRRIFLIKVDN